MGVVRPYFAMLLALMLVACSSMEVHSEYEKSVNFSSLKTFDWIAPKTKEKGSASVQYQFLDAQLRSAVERELAAKGYEKRAQGKPDFFIRYHVWVETHSDTNELNRGARWQHRVGPVDEGLGLDRGVGSTPLVGDYEEGTLLLIISDGGSQRPIWRASAKARLIPSDSQQKRKRKINEAVSNMLTKFPPK